MIIKSIPTDHHAFFISTHGKINKDRLNKTLEAELAKIFYDKELLVHRYIEETLTIGSARDIKTVQENKNRALECRIIIANFSSITQAAQNALLKVLEEPTLDTYLFLLTPNSEMLLPTVRSRCREVLIEDEESMQFGEYLARSYKERLAVTANLLANKSDIASFFWNLEYEIEQLPKNLNRTISNYYSRIINCKRNALSGSATTKYLLEEMALILPICKP